MLFPLLSAILGIIAFLPFNFWPFSFIFLVPLFIFFLKEENFWRLILGAFIFKFIFYLGTVYYTLEPITWTASILIFLGLPISIYFIKKLMADAVAPYWLLVIFPFLWTLFDHLTARYSFLPTYIITAGNALGSSPFIGLATIGGLTIMTFFVAGINVLIVFWKFRIFGIFIIIAILIASWQISEIVIQKNSVNYRLLKNSLKIAVVSSNRNFSAKINLFDSDIYSLKKELEERKTDLIVFPEDNNSWSLPLTQNLSKELNADIAATFDTFQNEKRYNSTILLNKNGEIVDIYNKNRLTFIGEYWPLGGWRPFFFDWLKRINNNLENYVVFNPGNPYSRGEKKLLVLNNIKFSSLICLETHYPSDLKEYKKMGAKFFINPSSNRWIDLGTRHFLYLNTNLRKIFSVWLETPIVVSGIEDFAGIITPDGKTNLINYENQDKNYAVFFGEIKY
ncbi:MAG: nitrilase-related carbon-nitrogen hydrolase [Patescibacteria group bacterium]